MVLINLDCHDNCILSFSFGCAYFFRDLKSFWTENHQSYLAYSNLHFFLFEKPFHTSQ